MNDFQMQIFFEIHSGNLREGPGSFESTQKAFTQITNLPENPSILDIGCGPGQQTLDLVQITNGKITAVDNYQTYLDVLISKAQNLGLEKRIVAMNGDMFNLNFEPHSFDIIWSEGAIYIIGLEKGLSEWKSYLKNDGYMAISHLTWLKESPPKEIFDYWKEEYPEITTIKNNLKVIQKCGFNIMNHFTLPKSDWLKNYYKPLVTKLSILESKYKNNFEALEVIKMETTEIELYKKYSDYYGYEFFILKSN